jgi:hypothetical protein
MRLKCLVFTVSITSALIVRGRADAEMIPEFVAEVPAPAAPNS